MFKKRDKVRCIDLNGVNDLWLCANPLTIGKIYICADDEIEGYNNINIINDNNAIQGYYPYRFISVIKSLNNNIKVL